MKKLVLLWILNIVSIHYINAQEEYEVEDQYGRVSKAVPVYDDPEVLPKWNINAKVFGLLFFNSEAFSYNISPTYRVNYKLTFNAHFAAAYNSKTDGNTNYGSSNKKGAKPCQEWSIMTHYIIKSAERTAIRNIKIGAETVGKNLYKFHYAKLPRVFKHNLSVDGGLGGYRYYHHGNLINTLNKSNKSDTSYNIANVSNTSLNLGVSYFKSESFEMTYSGGSIGQWRISRLYAFVSVGLGNQYHVWQSVSSKKGIAYSEAKDGFEKPKTIPIGYRIGFEKNFGSQYNGNSTVIGIEFGHIPGILNKSGQSVLIFHIGFGLGPMPDKL